MILTALDYFVIAVYFAVTIGIGLYFRNRASKDIAEYFVSGRSLPWWIAGTSMVATTFAADTPLAVTGLTISHGLAGNWVWWSFALGGMITVFVYAKLWRRSGVMTDAELVEMRYSGKPAALPRGSRAIYISLIVNPIIIGWVTSAMYMVLDETILFNVPASVLELSIFGESALAIRPWLIIFGTLALVGVYGKMSGMWGVAVVDAMQFCPAMFGCIALAWLSIAHFGGAANLEAKVIENFGGGGEPRRSISSPIFRARMHGCQCTFSCCCYWFSGGRPGTPELNRAVAATSFSEWQPAKVNVIRCWRRFGFKSPTTAFDHGPG